MAKLPIAVQLYTVRDDAEKDYAATIRRVAEIGYSGVELAGYGGLNVQSLKSLLDDTGLSIAGSHVAIERLEDELSRVIDENLSLDNQNIVVPWLSPGRRGDAASYRKLASWLNETGEALRGFGLQLLYHNHDFEIRPLEDGSVGLEIILANTDPQFVKAEVDTYWVLVGGRDPVDFIKQYTGRIGLIHLKDRDVTDGSFAEIGTGDLPLDALVAAAPKAGATWLIVEQDVCKRPPLDAIKISLDNLRSRGYA